jgi:hypothetical protein
MSLLANHARMGTIVPIAIAILIGTAYGSAWADPPLPAPMAPATAPIGHVQPNASNVPTNVLREENALEAQDTKLDKELNICTGC